ncbi:MAG TPA: DUF3800 domain-containing protein [Tepidisphaeraceae bacterium]|jgi:hypothetical protein|nr:DUF3800 domain-containing protein [Tepidisphaeraceae bacterium]
MHLIYLDESGNSGLNLSDPQQPVFTLCAMIVAEDQWQGLEAGLKAVLDASFPGWQKINGFEIHGSDLRRGTGHFAGIQVTERIAFRDQWMKVGESHGVRLIYRSVFKKMFSDWCVKEFGSGIRVHPHVAAFALLSRGIDNYLKTLPGPPLGMLISDENKEVVADIEKSIHVFRGLEGALRLGRIVEKGFFIDSSKSLPLQLCDLFTLSTRKKEERRRGFPPKSIDDSGIAITEKLLYADFQNDRDVLAWLTEERKKEAARG